jgi:hypothetical protein
MKNTCDEEAQVETMHKSYWVIGFLIYRSITIIN